VKMLQDNQLKIERPTLNQTNYQLIYTE